MNGSLVERLGGDVGLDRIIHDAYDRVLSIPELAVFFESSDVNKVKRMQRVFLQAALTDEAAVAETGISISAAHHGLGISRHHFSLFVNCFLDAMEATGSTDESDIDTVIGRLNTYADEVLGSSSVDG